jgi:ABC-type oligopeptide transport system substrate-binding subunit
MSACRVVRWIAVLLTLGATGLASGAGPQADPNKVLRTQFPAAETGFDPAQVHDLYSNTVIEALFEPLLTYDYLASPAKLVPRAAETLPEMQEAARSMCSGYARACISSTIPFSTDRNAN